MKFVTVGPHSNETPFLTISYKGAAERVQKRIAHWDKQNHAVPAPNCMLKVRGEIIKDKGL